MRAWLLVAVVVAVGGCDKLFSLPGVVEPTALDAITVDAPPPPCVPQPFGGTAQTPLFTQYKEFAVSTFDPTFGVGIVASGTIYDQPMPPTTNPPSVIFSNVASYPALAPDGKTLFFSHQKPELLETTNNGNGWTLPGPVGVPVPAAGFPGTPAVDPVTGDLHMLVMVASGTRFEEYVQTSVTWALRNGYSVMQVANVAAGTIDYPDLSADGLVLVFTLVGGPPNTPAGVYFVTRPSIDASFDIATNQPSHGLLLPLGANMRQATPQLSARCDRLTVVVTDTQGIPHVIRHGT